MNLSIKVGARILSSGNKNSKEMIIVGKKEKNNRKDGLNILCLV